MCTIHIKPVALKTCLGTLNGISKDPWMKPCLQNEHQGSHQPHMRWRAGTRTMPGRHFTPPGFLTTPAILVWKYERILSQPCFSKRSIKVSKGVFEKWVFPNFFGFLWWLWGFTQVNHQQFCCPTPSMNFRKDRLNDTTHFLPQVTRYRVSAKTPTGLQST